MYSNILQSNLDNACYSHENEETTTRPSKRVRLGSIDSVAGSPQVSLILTRDPFKLRVVTGDRVWHCYVRGRGAGGRGGP